MKKKPIWIGVLAVSLLVVAACVVFLVMYFAKPAPEIPGVGSTVSTEATDEATEATDLTEAPTEPETVNTFGYEIAACPEFTSHSFDELMQINPDVYGWLYIPNTAVDYPVAQNFTGKDDSFYLSHNVYREYQFSGTIYSENANSLYFDDPVTVLYGHNMLNGSMFASLHNFEDDAFFEENNTMFVFTADKVLTYLIYSAYVYDDRHILNSFNPNENEEMFLKYLNTTLEPRSYSAHVRENVELDKDSKILTLSTCTNGSPDTRYLVQGVLVNTEDRTD